MTPQTTTAAPGASLVCGLLSSLGAFALLAIVYDWVSIKDRVAEALAGITFGFLSAVLAPSGLACGIVALRKIRKGEKGSRAKAWAGITLASLPFALLLAWAVPVLWAEFSIRYRVWPVKELRGP